MGSFDVVNLFTTTPFDEALSVVRSRLEEDQELKQRTAHSVDTIMELVTVCINNTYFQYGDPYYKQVRGVAIGSPLSPVICNLFLEELESRAMNSFDPKPSVFLRYVNDIFLLWSESTRPIKEFHQHLNNQNASITFTVEKEVEGVIPFLDFW
jgi:hypothetical protein